MEVVGELTVPLYISRKTDYRPTPYAHYFYDYTRKPSSKYSHEDLDPALVSAFLFGSELNNAHYPKEDQIKEYLLNSCPRTHATVFSAHQALSKQGYMDRINLNTSAGYPHVTVGVNKHHMFHVDDKTGEVSCNNPSDLRNLQNYVDSWKDTIHEIPWIVSLKDCLDKDNKLCRIFEIPPVEYSIATRCYFGSFISMVHSIAGKKFSCIGMNPESMDWSDMYYDLASVSDSGLDADAPNWDKNLAAYLMYLAVETVNLWYRLCDPDWDPKHDIARYNILMSMINGYLLVGRWLLRKAKGMASGFVLTAILNTWVNMIMHLIWFLESVPRSLADASRYDDFVRTKLYGDDALDTIATSLQPYLNRLTMVEVWQRWCSMTITSSSKDSTLVPIDPLMSLTFLRRGFRRDGIVVKPLLDLKSLYSMICFVKKNNYATLQQQLLCNIRVFLGFAYFYGPNYFNIARKFLSSTYKVLLPQYQHYNHLYVTGGYDPTLFATSQNVFL